VGREKRPSCATAMDPNRSCGSRTRMTGGEPSTRALAANLQPSTGGHLKGASQPPAHRGEVAEQHASPTNSPASRTISPNTCRSLFRSSGCMFSALPAPMELEAGRLKKQAKGHDSADAGKGKGKKKGRVQGGERTDSKLVDDEVMEGLEEMDASEIARLFLVVLRLLPNLGARARQQEAVALIALVAPVGLQPVLFARQRAQGWVEVAQKARAEAKPEAETAKHGAISLACVVGHAGGLVKEGGAVGRANSKVSSARTETDAKMQLSANAQTIATANCSEQLGAAHKHGAAPMSHLERILHTGLNTHSMK
ncbi:unnamed protein product, partial [Prorocentrum cordatum]